jgi:enediyne biosynthesis protein E4
VNDSHTESSWTFATLCGLAIACASFAHAQAEVSWRQSNGFRHRELSFDPHVRSGFSRLPPELSRVGFTNVLTDAKAAENQIRLNGSGVALGDVDGDGWCDIYFCRLEGSNVLYRNLAEWKFEDFTAAAGVACAADYSTAAAFADIDGDGDVDLLVNSLGGGTRLFLNDGNGHFTESADSGLLRKSGSMSMALADVDGDGDLDLYVANYRTTTIRSTGLDMLNVNGRRMLRPQDRSDYEITPEGLVREHGEPDVLYRNDGAGRFSLVSWTDGEFVDEQDKPLSRAPRDWGQAVMFRDLNDDGAPDLYVCNDFWTPDRVWINRGDGRFKAASLPVLANTSTFSMGIDFADINRDGFDDFIVLDMLSPEHIRRMTQSSALGLELPSSGLGIHRPQVERNTMFLNRGDGTWTEISQLAGLSATEWSWCPVFLDVNLDGLEDLLVTTGHGFDTQDADAEKRINSMGPWPREKVPFKLFQYPRLALPNKAFRNRGDLTFEDVSGAWGFDTRGVSHGMALADLDGDGDLDVVVNNLNGEAGVYRNEGSGPRVGVRLKGVAPNTRGIGAKIWGYGGAVAVQSQEMICGGRYLSSDEAMRVFAAGSATNEMRIEVKWRSGKRSVVSGVKGNRIYEIDERGAESINPQPTTHKAVKPLFEDVSGMLGHRHQEEEFNDYERQPLLPRKLSQLGPGVGWYDVDGDGWEDLMVGSGKGGKLGVYQNDGKGGFNPIQAPLFNQTVTRDQTGVLGWTQEGRRTILAGWANYEDGLAMGTGVREYDVKAGKSEDRLPGSQTSAGPLALGDIEGDGDLDLFVGGRVNPGRYPEPASSWLLRNEKGKLQLDVKNTRALERVGLVSGAVFSDLDGDGKPELILACEWGPIRVFKNEGGKLVPWDVPVTLNHQSSTLNQLSGWWNGVTTGDFDNDGRLDLVVSNWGRNTRYESHRSEPLKMYYGDMDGDGTVDVVEAYYDETMKKEVPERGLDVMGKSMPYLREKYSTHRAYAEAGVAEILGLRVKQAGKLEVGTLESLLLLNRGERYEARALPVEAQMSPGYAVCVGDSDGDGQEDLFLSQNFFAMNAENGRCDAGRGLWMKGDGEGNMRSVPGQESGVKVYGEQRGAALGDYDGDGRVDLVVTQNGAETRLYHNVGGKPGLRIRLKGPAGNPLGVGAQIRLRYGEKLGPAREVHAGSGYWSQDSAVQVMATPQPPTHLLIQWPDGKKTTSPIPEQAKEIEVNPSGGVKAVR